MDGLTTTAITTTVSDAVAIDTVFSVLKDDDDDSDDSDDFVDVDCNVDDDDADADDVLLDVRKFSFCILTYSH
jgi:hypothetical protein